VKKIFVGFLRQFSRSLGHAGGKLGRSGGILFLFFGSPRDTASTHAKRALLDDTLARDDGSKMEEP
jgi:hypothetical protein